MSLKTENGTRWFEFQIFQTDEVRQAIFTRHGGVSPEPWASLNVGGTVGDDPGRVAENRKRVFETARRAVASAYDVWQIHSAEVVHATEPRGSAPPLKADIIITANPAVTLFMRFADCVPIFLLDPITPAIAMVHAGWLGTVRRAAEIAVDAMAQAFGTSPDQVVAGIGPSVGPDHYEVGQDVIDQFTASFGREATNHIHQKDRRKYLDLWSANQYLLQSMGVENIENAGICTVCHNDDWFSHRAERGSTGRFAAIFSLV